MKSFACLLVLIAWAGCDDKDKNTTPPPTPPPQLAMDCPAAMAGVDFYTLPSGLGAYDATHRGEGVKCEYLAHPRPADANAPLARYDYTAAPAKSGFFIFRIIYRTERAAPVGATAPVEGDSGAVLLIPETQNDLPLVVFAHG